MKDMGVLNDDWGICGVTSSFYAMYAHSPPLKHGPLSAIAQSRLAMVDVIRGYIRALLTDGEFELLGEIQTFTRSFEGYEAWSVRDYLTRADAALDARRTPHGNFSLAMHPAAVVDFLKRTCDFQNPSQIWQANAMRPDATPFLNTGKELIIGVIDPNMTLYGGLCHWLYQSPDGRIHSWGKTFADVGAAGASIKEPGWGICSLISPGG